MMDTILNLGLNDEVAAGLIAGNPDPKFERFVYDSYRRFIQMFSDVVMEISKKTLRSHHRRDQGEPRASRRTSSWTPTT